MERQIRRKIKNYNMDRHVLNAMAVDNSLEYARLALDGNL